MRSIYRQTQMSDLHVNEHHKDQKLQLRRERGVKKKTALELIIPIKVKIINKYYRNRHEPD